MDEKVLYKLIGERVKQHRINAGMSQAQLAEAAGHLRTAVANLEAGRHRPQLYLLYGLCEQLGVPVSSVLPLGSELQESSLVAVDTGRGVAHLPPVSAGVLQRMLGGKRSKKRTRA